MLEDMSNRLTIFSNVSSSINVEVVVVCSCGVCYVSTEGLGALAYGWCTCHVHAPLCSRSLVQPQIPMGSNYPQPRDIPARLPAWPLDSTTSDLNSSFLIR